MTDRASAYVALAKQVIPLAKTADDLRRWWTEEAARRDEYGLTDDQVSDLVQACSAHVATLGDQPARKERVSARKRASLI